MGPFPGGGKNNECLEARGFPVKRGCRAYLRRMARQKQLVVIGGPTAVGKTAAAIEVARALGTEILSADSRQFYRELNIGTAKPSPEELAAVPHHLVNSLSIHQDYSVGDFERDALQLLQRLFQRYDTLLLVGGSGLYIRAVCEGLDDFPEVPPEVREQVRRFYEAEGLEALQEELRRYDPAYFARVDRRNPQRLLRALEVCRATGRPFSSFRRGEPKPRPFKPLLFYLTLDRALLYERIDQRVDAMMAAGLLEEARALFPHRHLNALQTVGYRELFDHLEGKTSLEEAVRLIKRNTRRYAKRQLTYFRNQADFQPLPALQPQTILQTIQARLSDG